MTAPSLLRGIGTIAFAFTIINTIVGSGIFGLPAAAAGIMGPAAVLGYVGCSILVGLVALCFAESGSRLPETGGTYAWSRAAFGPAVGSSVLITAVTDSGGFFIFLGLATLFLVR